MLETLLALLIAMPFAAGAAVWLLRASSLRAIFVFSTCAVLAVSAVLLAGQAPFVYAPGPAWRYLVRIADFTVLFVVLYYGYKHYSPLIMILAGVQMLLLAWLEFFRLDHAAAHAVFRCDNLALILVFIVCIVGGLVCVYGLPYMNRHEKHLGLKRSRQHQFFAVMLAFLGAMNGLALADDLVWFYFFFEVTTLCSYWLIAHDGTQEAVKNAVRALWMNSLGGAAFAAALVWINADVGLLTFRAVLDAGYGTGFVFFPIALLCFAGLTKAAQAPFQAWLLGAMVAPTPVSALLHSSTMVKAGVYLVLRLAPVMSGSFTGLAVSLCGAFTFVAAAALAVGQSNGKKVLAYSTVSNLGLILACAGLGSPLALTAAVMLMIYHAVSKGLLFLCVGTMEQGIGSRNIEDMRGVYAVMPRTTLIAAAGIMTMILPPFGMLLGKWMAVEAAAANIFVVVMLVFGSALTVLYWARWAGTLISDAHGGPKARSPQRLASAILGVLLTLAVILSLAAPLVYTKAVAPVFASTAPAFKSYGGMLVGPYGAYPAYPLFILAGIGLAFALAAAKKSGKAKLQDPYLGGAAPAGPGRFVGPMNRPVDLAASNYYLENLFGEGALTAKVNLAALLLIVMLFGGAL